MSVVRACMRACVRAGVELCAERMSPACTSAFHGPSLFAHSIHMKTLHNLRVLCTAHFHTQDLHECLAQSAKPLHSPLPHHSRLWREWSALPLGRKITRGVKCGGLFLTTPQLRVARALPHLSAQRWMMPVQRFPQTPRTPNVLVHIAG